METICQCFRYKWFGHSSIHWIKSESIILSIATAIVLHVRLKDTKHNSSLELIKSVDVRGSMMTYACFESEFICHYCGFQHVKRADNIRSVIDGGK